MVFDAVTLVAAYNSISKWKMKMSTAMCTRESLEFSCPFHRLLGCSSIDPLPGTALQLKAIQGKAWRMFFNYEQMKLKWFPWNVRWWWELFVFVYVPFSFVTFAPNKFNYFPRQSQIISELFLTKERIQQLTVFSLFHFLPGKRCNYEIKCSKQSIT